jgi:hypothetical protein
MFPPPFRAAILEWPPSRDIGRCSYIRSHVRDFRIFEQFGLLGKPIHCRGQGRARPRHRRRSRSEVRQDQDQSTRRRAHWNSGGEARRGDLGRRAGHDFACPQRTLVHLHHKRDLLEGITMGSPLRPSTARGDRIDIRVTELRPLGEFAVWRAARAVGDHDINSFLVRSDPAAPSDGLEAGMTAWLDC